MVQPWGYDDERAQAQHARQAGGHGDERQAGKCAGYAVAPKPAHGGRNCRADFGSKSHS